MFRTPYSVRIKILIFNQLKIFNSLLSFLLVQFLVSPLLTSVYPIYKPLIQDGFLKLQCFSLDFSRMGIKLPIFSHYGFCRFLVRREYLYYMISLICIQASLPLSVLFFSIKSNPQHYRAYYNVLNYFARKLYSCLLFNHTHEFLHFYFSCSQFSI